MKNNEYDLSSPDTPFSQASFDFRNGDELGDRSYVVYDFDQSSSTTPFTPASFVYRTGKDLVDRLRLDSPLETPCSESALLQGSFDYRPGKVNKERSSKRQSSSAMVEYSSSFAFQNYKNKHKNQGSNINSNPESRQRPQDLRLRSCSDSELSDDEFSGNNVHYRQQHRGPKRPISTFDGGIYSNTADISNAVINPQIENHEQRRPKPTQLRKKSSIGRNIKRLISRSKLIQYSMLNVEFYIG